MVAAGDRAAVVRGGVVQLIDELGRTIAHLDTEVGGAGEAASATTVDAGWGRAPASEEILELHGVPEAERDGEAAEALVEEETTLRARRAGREARVGDGETVRDARRRGRRPLIAAAGRRSPVWVSREGRLWRIDRTGGIQRVPGVRPPFEHLAAGGDDQLIAAEGGRIWRSDDGGQRFTLLARVAPPVRGVALAATSGAAAWASARQLSWTTPERSASFTVHLPSPARDLRFCDDTLLVLDERGWLLAAHGRGLVPLFTAPAGARARRIGCAAEGTGPWLLVDPALLWAADRGAPFADRTAALAGNVPVDAGVGDRCVWVATGAGLTCLPLDGAAPLAATPAGAAAPPWDAGIDASWAWTAVTRRPPRWASLLPRVTLATSAAFSDDRRRDLRAVAFADFPLGAPPAEPRPPPPDAAAMPPVVTPPGRAAAQPLPPDPDAHCLLAARARAVTLALAEPERARAFVERARRAPWLPELRVRVDRRIGRNESIDVPAGAPSGAGPLGLDTANDVRYEARATWDLSKLLFSTEELAAQSQALRMADVRREVESLTNRLYFERRRLKMDSLLGPGADLAVRARNQLRIEEVEAELDVLSGGTFGRCLAPMRAQP